MNFYIPNRQAPVGIIVNFVYGLQKFIRALFPILILLIVRINKGDWPIAWHWMFLGVLFFLILVLVGSYLHYRNFTFHIEKDTEAFVVQKGIFNKTKTTIQLAKIQQVNINQSFINKVLNLFDRS